MYIFIRTYLKKLWHSALSYWVILWDLHVQTLTAIVLFIFKTLGTHLMLVLDAYWDFVQEILNFDRGCEESQGS